MHKNKIIIKTIIALGIILLIAIIGFVIMLVVQEIDSKNDLTTFEQSIVTVTKDYPTQFIVYGEEMDFPKECNVTYIDDINADAIKMDETFKYQLIVINDLNSKTEMSKEDWQLLNDHIKSDKRHNLFYFGNKEFGNIAELDITDGACSSLADTDLSFGFVYEGETLIKVLGSYRQNAGYSLMEVLLHEQAYSIEKSNK